MHADSHGIFADHALELRAFGLAVIPVEGKSPQLKGYRQWRSPPSSKMLERLAGRFPNANIGILPGPSKVFVADVDVAGQADEVEGLLGRTPLHVRSRRGVHLYYRDQKGTHGLPATLAALGLKVDLKGGCSIVVAPPSVHESGAIYRHDNCDWGALRDLPPPDINRLRKALERTTVREPQFAQPDERYTEGHRGLGLNRILCRHAAFCDDFEGLLDVARNANADFPKPLEDKEVVKRAKQVWRDAEAGKLEPWVGGKSVVRTNAAEVKQLSALSRNGPDAFMLLMLLKAEHGARCRRGETFFIVADAMQRAGSLPRWSSKRITAARDILLKAGLIIRVTAARSIGTRVLPAEYSLAGTGGAARGGQYRCIVSQIGRKEAQP